MGDITAVTNGGARTVLSDKDVEQLASTLRGRVLRAGEPEYEVGRRVWNGLIDRRPALIVRCAGVEDVVAAVRLARERDVRLSVRGGGHGVAGLAVADSGLMIDLSEMNHVVVDAEARTA